MTGANLARIPGTADVLAADVLDRAPDVVDGLFLRTVDRQSEIALGRYGVRAVTPALRNRDPLLLRRALLATAIADAAAGEDPRDAMVTMALHHFCAQQLGMRPSAVFDEVATRIADQSVADLLREFGSRTDITLAAFGWTLVETTNGLDFEPA